MMKLIIFLTMLLCFTGLKAQEEVDKLSLASLLIKNNNFSKAQAILGNIKDPNDVQTDRYYMLLGILAVKQKRFKVAVEKLLLAEKSGLDKKDEPEFYETLGRAYLLSKNYKKASAVLINKEKLLENRPLYYQLLSKLNFETENEEIGWTTLGKGISKFPKYFPMKKQKWFYLFSNNLLEVSKNYLFEIINEGKLSALDLAKIAYQYRLKKDLVTAAILGELARLKEPGNEEIAKELARTYIEKQEILSAAQVVESLALKKSKFMAEASELWRKAGYPVHAERLALEISDPMKSLQQKIILALEAKNFLRISQLAPLVQRTELKSNEEVQYTLAYTHFMLGKFIKAEKYLGSITRKDLLKKALSLRETIQSCSENEEMCL